MKQLFSEGLLHYSSENRTNYSTVIEFLKVSLSFAILRSSIRCLHSSRSSARHLKWLELGLATLAMTEGQVG